MTAADSRRTAGASVARILLAHRRTGSALKLSRRDGVDGVLVDRAEAGAVREAVRRVAGERWDAQALAARAAEFSRERFVARLGRYVGELLGGAGSPAAPA